MTSNIAPETHLDVLYLPKLVDSISEAIEKGYGEVVFKVTVRAGKVTLVSLTQTETHTIDTLVGKE
jgi:hypothetical protein